MTGDSPAVDGPERSSSQPLAVGTVSLRLYPPDVPAVDQVAELRSQAAIAAEVGFDGVMVSEHHADFPGYLPNPVQLSGFLLESMESGWAAPCPLLLPMKPHALVAEELAWLAATHPGRVGAGFAAGALPVDFELAEVPFEEIVARFKQDLPRVVAALRGSAPEPLGADRALKRLVDDPLPMVVAAQSVAAVRRAASLGLGVLYDSLQAPEACRRLSDAYEQAGGEGARILIRRVWIGDPPAAETEAQLAHYRSYAPDRAMATWAEDSGLVTGRDIDEVIDSIAAVMDAARCDSLNIRIQVAGLDPSRVRDQMAGYAGHLGSIRQAMRSPT